MPGEGPVVAERRAAQQPHSHLIESLRPDGEDARGRVAGEHRPGQDPAVAGNAAPPALARQEEDQRRQRHRVARMAQHRARVPEPEEGRARAVGQSLPRGQSGEERAQHVDLGFQAPEPPRLRDRQRGPAERRLALAAAGAEKDPGEDRGAGRAEDPVQDLEREDRAAAVAEEAPGLVEEPPQHPVGQMVAVDQMLEIGKLDGGRAGDAVEVEVQRTEGKIQQQRGGEDRREKTALGGRDAHRAVPMRWISMRGPRIFPGSGRNSASRRPCERACRT